MRIVVVGSGLAGVTVAEALAKHHDGTAITLAHGLRTAAGVRHTRPRHWSRRAHSTGHPAIHALGDVAEVRGRLYPFVARIRSQALWLAEHVARRTDVPWCTPAFKPAVKIHGWNPAIVRRHDVAVRGDEVGKNPARQAAAGSLP